MAIEPVRSRIEGLRAARTANDAVAQVTVVIVNYNSGPYLSRCLAALQGQTFRDFTVIVVDNASKDESLQALDRLPEGWQALRLQENVGFAAGNNRAIAMAGSPWIATLNPDAFAEPDWLAQLMRATKRYPDAAAFGSLQIDANHPDRLDGAGDAYNAAGLPWRGAFGQPMAGNCREGEVASPCAAAALYHRETLLAVGAFDEDFFCYCEDVDLGLRLRLAGHRSIQLTNAVVRHVGGGSGGGQSRFARYHGVRNRLWLFVKDMPGPLFWPVLPLHLAMTIVLAVRSTLRRELPVYIEAIGDALRGFPRIFAKRREIQRSRSGSLLRVLCWSPLAAMRRRAVVRLTSTIDNLDPSAGDGGIGVAMVSYRTGPVLFEAIDAALADSTVERLVLVDNGNSAEDRARLAKRAAGEPRLRIVEGQGNVGFATACNIAVRLIDSEYVLILNPDCVLPEHGAQKFRAEMRRRDRPGLMGAVMVGEEGKVQRATRRNLPSLANLLGEATGFWRLGLPRIEITGEMPRLTAPVPAISGAAMFLTRENYWGIGGLDSGFFLHVEDLDLCRRFQAADGEVCLVPGIRIRHARSSSKASPLFVEWHKTQGFRRYFRKCRLTLWQRPLMEIAISFYFALLVILSPVRRRGSG